MKTPRIVLLVLFALFPVLAHPQTTTTNATLRFTAPIQRTDGTAIAGPLTYIVLAGPRGGAKTRLTVSNVTPAGTTLQSQAPGSCYQVIAIEANIESAASNEACIQSPPNPATSLTVTIAITVTQPSP